MALGVEPRVPCSLAERNVDSMGIPYRYAMNRIASSQPFAFRHQPALLLLELHSSRGRVRNV